MPKIMERGVEMTEVSAVRPAQMRERRDIEWLVNWALKKQRVASVDGCGNDWALLGHLKSQLGSLGMKVDGGGGAIDKSVVAHDAEIIWARLCNMLEMPGTAEAAALVYRHGMNGTQPDWGHDGVGRYVLQRRQAGKGKAIKRYRDQRNGRGLIGFEWKWIGHSVETVEVMMLEWAAWHAALRELRDLINPAMKTYVATGPVWEAEPWDNPLYIKAQGQLGDLEVETA